MVEATGNPVAAVDHALHAFAHGKHVVMVPVDADAWKRLRNYEMRGRRTLRLLGR